MAPFSYPRIPVMIIRSKKGRGFCYEVLENRQKAPEETIKWIRSLRIPPAWSNVQISSNPRARILATGFDKKGRKQYIYHPAFLEKNNKRKFKRLVDLIQVLPKIRSSVNELLQQKRWSKEKTLALAVRLLDQFSIRVGNECYTKINGSVGLATLKKEHLITKKSETCIAFKGKSGKDHCLIVTDPQLVLLLKALSRLPGKRLLVYRDEQGELRNINAADINSFLKEISGGLVTAKDFRTWKGTVTALEMVGEAEKEAAANKRKKLSTLVVNKVSKVLGNTMAICRSYYIHPTLMRMLDQNKLSARVQKLAAICKNIPNSFSLYEYMAARMLYNIT